MPTALHNISQEDMWKLLGKTEESMKMHFPELPTLKTTVNNMKKPDQDNQYKRCTVYLNLLSETVHKKLGWSINTTVINKLTRQTLRQALGGHPFFRSP
jgi:hypothetical protein